MQIEPISLSHSQLLRESFHKLQLDICEYSFANLYLYRKTDKCTLIFDGVPFIKGQTYDGKTFIMPTTDIRTYDTDALKRLLQDVDFLFPIPEEWLPHFEKAGFKSSFLEQDSDYVYQLEKLSNYPGRHLSSRRNLLYQFEEEYNAISSPLSQDALKILETWQSSSHHQITDYEPCKEAIEQSQTLGLIGRMYVVDQKPVGFIIGEPLNDRMFVIHFAKADVSYKGIYPYMYHSFAKELEGRFQLLNWEQDLGIEGLRQSKSAYQPDKHIRKYRVHS